jgi:hypothetical protein
MKGLKCMFKGYNCEKKLATKSVSDKKSLATKSVGDKKNTATNRMRPHFICAAQNF